MYLIPGVNPAFFLQKEGTRNESRRRLPGGISGRALGGLRDDTNWKGGAAGKALERIRREGRGKNLSKEDRMTKSRVMRFSLVILVLAFIAGAAQAQIGG